MSEIIPFSKTGQTWSTEDHKKHGQTVGKYAAGAIDRDACIAQMRAMLGMTDQPKAAPVAVEKPARTNADLAPIYAPDPFDNAAEYVASCRKSGRAIPAWYFGCVGEV
jgi:3-methyladenine DNA glycosylase/8-oxoguanine DNA glycosylase